MRKSPLRWSTKAPTHGSLAQALATTSRFGRESSGYAGSELVVARRLPLADDLVDETLKCLAWDDAAWSSVAMRERDMAALKDLGWPGKLGYWIGQALRF